MVWVFKASQLSQMKAIEEIASKLEPKLAAKFIEAVETMAEHVSVAELQEAIEFGDIAAIIEASGVLQLPPLLEGAGLAVGAVSFSDQLLVNVAEGGKVGIEALPKKIQLSARFDIVNPRVAEFMATYRPTLIRELDETTRDAVTDTFRRGMLNNQPPTRIAQDIKEIVGLTTKQSRAVVNYRAQLESASNLTGMQQATDRLLGVRDERMTARQLRLNHLKQDQIDRLVERYRKRLVRQRAETIARTEVFRGVQEGKREAWQQAIDDGFLDPQEYGRKVVTARDDRVRPEHRAVPKMNPEPVGINEPFKTPWGPRMGPPWEISCRCTDLLVKIR